MGFFGFELDRKWFADNGYQVSNSEDFLNDIHAAMSNMNIVISRISEEERHDFEEEKEFSFKEDVDGNITMIDGNGLIKEIKP